MLPVRTPDVTMSVLTACLISIMFSIGSATRDINALLIIDVQNCFLSNGSLAVADGEATIPLINNLRRDYAFDVVALTQDFHCQDHVSFASQHPEHGVGDDIKLQYLPSGEYKLMLD